VVLAGYCAFLQLYATQPLLPLLARVFHASEVAVSLTVTVPTLGVALAAPLVGVLADRLGRRRVIVWSAFLLAAFALLTASASSLRELIFWRFWQGVCTPGMFAVTVAYINDEWREAGAGRVISAYVSGTALGGLSSRLVAGVVAAHATWPHVFVVLGILNLSLAVAVWAWLPQETASLRSRREGTLGSALAAHFRNRPLVASWAVGFCNLFSMVGLFTYVVFLLAAAPFGFQPAALGSIFFVYLAGAAVTPIAGRAIDRYGHRISLATAITTSACGVALTLAGHAWIVILGLAVCCTGVFTAQAAASNFVGTAAERNRALAVGLYATFYYIGGSVGGVVPGYFFTWGGWRACAASIVAVQGITVLIALVFWKPAEGWHPSGDVRSAA
jgi:MFS transporter, YNFM family, putative membrane transport protein